MAQQNYTEEQVTTLVAAYKAAETEAERLATVAAYAETFGKTPASIRAKLVREGVYIAKEYKTKTGDKPESKDDIVTDIARTLGVTVDAVGSLEKATKKALRLIRENLKEA